MKNNLLNTQNFSNKYSILKSTVKTIKNTCLYFLQTFNYGFTKPHYFLFFISISMANIVFSIDSKTNTSGLIKKVSKENLESYVSEISKETKNPYDNLEEFISKIKNRTNLLPNDYLQKILNFKNNKNRSYILFKNLPTDKFLCKTPGDIFNKKDKNSFVSEILLTSFSVILGEPFNYIQEENGNLFRNIRPTKNNQYEQTSDGSKTDLELHTETAFHSLKPDFLMLYCLRGDRNKQAFTLVSELNDVLKELKNKTDIIETLKKPLYITGIDVSFGNTNKDKFVYNVPVLYYDKDQTLMITYDLDLMKGTTKKSQKALEVLTKAIKKVQKGVLLEPGDMIILDNRRIIHGRTAFNPYFDGYDRWLQRVYVSSNESFTKNITSEHRIVKTIF